MGLPTGGGHKPHTALLPHAPLPPPLLATALIKLGSSVSKKEMNIIEWTTTNSNVVPNCVRGSGVDADFPTWQKKVLTAVTFCLNECFQSEDVAVRAKSGLNLLLRCYPSPINPGTDQRVKSFGCLLRICLHPNSAVSLVWYSIAPHQEVVIAS